MREITLLIITLYLTPAVATYVEATAYSSRSSNVYQSVSCNALSLDKMKPQIITRLK